MDQKFYWTNGLYVIHGRNISNQAWGADPKRDWHIYGVVVKSPNNVYHVGQTVKIPLYHTPESENPQWTIIKTKDLFNEENVKNVKR